MGLVERTSLPQFDKSKLEFYWERCPHLVTDILTIPQTKFPLVEDTCGKKIKIKNSLTDLHRSLLEQSPYNPSCIGDPRTESKHLQYPYFWDPKSMKIHSKSSSFTFKKHQQQTW